VGFVRGLCCRRGGVDVDFSAKRARWRFPGLHCSALGEPAQAKTWCARLRAAACCEIVTHVLARVTQDGDRPRGPDVELAVRVPTEWLLQGATLEIELPRNLACALCSGGGCDTCGRAGAVSLRGRKDDPQVVEVTLPSQRQDASDSPARNLVLRIPEQGGLPLENAELPRGNLLLRFQAAELADAGVARIRRTIFSGLPPRGSLPPLTLSPRSIVATVAIAGTLAWLLWRFL